MCARTEVQDATVGHISHALLVQECTDVRSFHSVHVRTCTHMYGGMFVGMHECGLRMHVCTANA